MRLGILIPLISIVSSFLTLSVIVWARQRRKERESFYRFELSRLMLERYADGQERVFAWLQEQQAGDDRRSRDSLRLTAWVFLTGGAGALVGLGFTTHEDSLFGWVPIGVAVGLFIHLVVTRTRSPA